MCPGSKGKGGRFRMPLQKHSRQNAAGPVIALTLIPQSARQAGLARSSRFDSVPDFCLGQHTPMRFCCALHVSILSRVPGPGSLSSRCHDSTVWYYDSGIYYNRVKLTQDTYFLCGNVVSTRLFLPFHRRIKTKRTIRSCRYVGTRLTGYL